MKNMKQLKNKGDSWMIRKKIIIAIITFFIVMISCLYMQHRTIQKNREDRGLAKILILAHYNRTNTMEYLSEVIEQNPSKENLMHLRMEINHLSTDVMTLMLLSPNQLDTETWERFKAIYPLPPPFPYMYEK